VEELFVIFDKTLEEDGKGETNNILMDHNGGKGAVWLEVNQIE
jgi:hypothetical protein